jgi:hypothetical protein
MKDNLTFFDILPQKFTQSMQVQVMTGILPSHTVENMLSPLLDNFHSLYPRLSPDIQKQVWQILNVYPEIAIAYKINKSYSNMWKRFLIRSQMTNNWAWKLCTKKNSVLSRSQIMVDAYINQPVQSFIRRGIEFCSDNMPGVSSYPTRYALAFAVMLLAILFQFSNYFIPDKSMDILSATSMLNELAQIVDMNALKNPQLVNRQGKMGFSESQSYKKQAFEVGFHIAGMALSKRCENVANFQHHLLIVNSFIQFHKKMVPSSPKDDSQIVNLDMFQSVDKHVREIIAYNNMNDQFRLGQWFAIAQSVIYSENIDAIHAFFSETRQLNIVQSLLKKINAPADWLEFVKFMQNRSINKSFTKNDMFLLKTKIDDVRGL